MPIPTDAGHVRRLCRRCRTCFSSRPCRLGHRLLALPLTTPTISSQVHEPVSWTHPRTCLPLGHHHPAQMTWPPPPPSLSHVSPCTLDCVGVRSLLEQFSHTTRMSLSHFPATECGKAHMTHRDMLSHSPITSLQTSTMSMLSSLLFSAPPRHVRSGHAAPCRRGHGRTLIRGRVS